MEKALAGDAMILLIIKSCASAISILKPSFGSGYFIIQSPHPGEVCRNLRACFLFSERAADLWGVFKRIYIYIDIRETNYWFTSNYFAASAVGQVNGQAEHPRAGFALCVGFTKGIRPRSLKLMKSGNFRRNHM